MRPKLLQELVQDYMHEQSQKNFMRCKKRRRNRQTFIQKQVEASK